MKPKNAKQRTNSFLKFLLLFIVTVGTIITAIFFNFKVPKKENEVLKTQAKAIKREMEIQNEFSNGMIGVKKLFDSLDVPGSNKKFLNTLISDKLVSLQAIIPTKDSTYRYDMYTNIVKLNLGLLDAKERLHELRDAESSIEKYDLELDNCKQDYKQLQRDMDRLRARRN